jgi:phosphatidylserine/phosphatidylglycerophosphate/cardiolipin synthase-like enzyme
MLKRSVLSLFVILSFAASLAAQDAAQVVTLFSPNGGCEKAICSAINSAEKEILVAAYSFSSKPIAVALYNATTRGVPVYVILDKGQVTAHYSMADDLAKSGLAVRIDHKEAIQHQKTIIIDRKLLIAGSFNFTASAEHRNAETLLLIYSEAVAKKAVANWTEHYNHSQPHAYGDPWECSNGNCPVKPSQPSQNHSYRRIRRW